MMKIHDDLADKNGRHTSYQQRHKLPSFVGSNGVQTAMRDDMGKSQSKLLKSAMTASFGGLKNGGILKP